MGMESSLLQLCVWLALPAVVHCASKQAQWQARAPSVRALALHRTLMPSSTDAYKRLLLGHAFDAGAVRV